MKSFVVILLFCSSILAGKSQEGGVALDVGYSFKFINQSVDQLYLGAIGSYSSGNRGYSSYSKQVVFGAGAYYKTNGKEKFWIPAINVGYGSAVGLLYKVSVTPYYVTPSFSLNLFNLGQIGTGYSFGYRKKDGINFNGAMISFNININIIGQHRVNVSN